LDVTELDEKTKEKNQAQGMPMAKKISFLALLIFFRLSYYGYSSRKINSEHYYYYFQWCVRERCFTPMPACIFLGLRTYLDCIGILEGS